MASETESLNLVVNLTDNATAGLAKLRGELTNIGSGQQTQNLRRFKEELGSVHKIAHELAGEFIGLSRAVPVIGRELSTGLTGVMGMLGPVGLGVAAIGGAVAAVILEVNKLATELRGIRNISNVIGIDPATLKTFQDRAREVGVSAEVVTSTLHGMRNALAELYKPAGGTLRATVLAHTKAGQIAETEQFLENLKGMTNEQRFKAIIHRGENVFRHELERTRSAGRPGGDTGAAAQKRGEYLAQFGIDEQARLLGDKFKEMTAEERKAYNERNAAGAKAADAESRLGTEIHRVGEELFAGTELMNKLTAAARVLTNILKALHPGALPSSMRGAVPGAAAGAKYGSWLGPVGTAAGAVTGAAVGGILGGSSEEPGGLADQMGISGIPKGTGPAGVVEPQYFGGPLSTHIEDRRGEHDDSNKLLTDNTAQLKRIADMMEVNKEEGSQLNFGPANVARPGDPGTAGGGFAAPGAAPNGSSVGPGAGAGAGTTIPGGGGIVFGKPNVRSGGFDPDVPSGGLLPGMGGGPFGGRPYGSHVGPGTGAGAGAGVGGGIIPGGGGLPGMGGGSGAGAPYGSHVGPGTGRGAGGGDIRGTSNVDQALRSTAASAGMDPAHWKAIASIESDLDPKSNLHRATQYKGLFQIGRDEWHRQGHGGNIYDPQQNAETAARLMQENIKIFRKRFGRDPSAAETYLMHQQGAGFYTAGKMTNIRGNWPPGYPRNAPMNHHIFEREWTRVLNQRAAKFATGAGPSIQAERIMSPEMAGPAQGGGSAQDSTFMAPGGAGGLKIVNERDDLLDARRAIDARGGRQSVKVDATGKVNADIRAPKNAENTPLEGLFRNTEPNRQAQMTEAHRGPVDVQPAAPSGF